MKHGMSCNHEVFDRPCSKVFQIISRNLIQKGLKTLIFNRKNKTILLGLKQTQYIRLCGHYRRNQQETQSISTHDMLKGFQSIIRRFQTRSAFCKFSKVVESFTTKEEDGLTSYVISDVLEAKTFRYNFMEGHNVWGNLWYSSSIHRNIVAILATNFQDLVAKVKNLVALTPVLGTIWCPAYSLLFTVFEAVLKRFERFSAGGSVPLARKKTLVGHVQSPSECSSSI